MQNDLPTRGIHQIAFYRQRPVESRQDRPLLEAAGSRELFQKRLRHLQIDRVKALCEPPVDLGEQAAGIVLSTLALKEPGEACRRT